MSKTVKIFVLATLLVSFLGILVWKYYNRPKVKLHIEFVQEFGSLEDKNKMIGFISDFKIDSAGNVYVIDAGYKNVKKFSKEGNINQVYGFGEGSGPGEFRAPNAVDIDIKGNVYVVDKVLRTISVFDSSNNLLHSVRIQSMPAQIIAQQPKNVFIVGFPFTYKGNLIQKYNLTTPNATIPETSFCERIKGKDSLMIVRSGNSGRLISNNKGEIYYSFSYPYEIRRFSNNGKLIGQIERQVGFFSAPYFDGKVIRNNSGIIGLICLPNNLVGVITVRRSGDDASYFFDLFNESGDFYGSFSGKDLGIDNIRYIKSDRLGNIYLDGDDPYPNIKKYKLSVEFL